MTQAKLGESGSERRRQRLRNCVLCFGDEICRYHRDDRICDRIIKVGLRSVKVPAVESRQPHDHRNKPLLVVMTSGRIQPRILFCVTQISNFQTNSNGQTFTINV